MISISNLRIQTKQPIRVKDTSGDGMLSELMYNDKAERKSV